jgi:Ricin-type beta-trefoil lectin domain
MDRRTSLVVVVTAVFVLAVLGAIRLVAADAAGGGPIIGVGGECVDIAAGSAANGTPVRLHRCNRTLAQQWTIGGDGTVRALHRCSDVTSGSTANGAYVQVFTCNGSPAQRWTVSGAQLINGKSGRCLSAAGPGSAAGSRLQVRTCTGGADQSWRLPVKHQPAPAPATGGAE